MICQKSLTAFLLLLSAVVLLTGCKDMCPRSGRWETEDKSLVITFDEMPYKAHFWVDDKYTDYYLSIEYGYRDIELYVTFDEDPVLVGRILGYSDNLWVVSFGGSEYQLHQSSIRGRDTSQSGDGSLIDN